jgi:hypothetical protein
MSTKRVYNPESKQESLNKNTIGDMFREDKTYNSNIPIYYYEGNKTYEIIRVKVGDSHQTTFVEIKR